MTSPFSILVRLRTWARLYDCMSDWIKLRVVNSRRVDLNCQSCLADWSSSELFISHLLRWFVNLPRQVEKITFLNWNIHKNAKNTFRIREEKMGAVSSAPSDLSDYDEDPTEATLIYETVNIDEIKKDAAKSLNPAKSKKVLKR